jgi:hypothetical protein
MVEGRTQGVVVLLLSSQRASLGAWEHAIT